MCVTFVQRFETWGRRFTYFHHYYYEKPVSRILSKLYTQPLITCQQGLASQQVTHILIVDTSLAAKTNAPQTDADNLHSKLAARTQVCTTFSPPYLVDFQHVVELVHSFVEASRSDFTALVQKVDAEQTTFTPRVAPCTNAGFLGHTRPDTPPVNSHSWESATPANCIQQITMCINYPLYLTK